MNHQKSKLDIKKISYLYISGFCHLVLLILNVIYVVLLQQHLFEN